MDQWKRERRDSKTGYVVIKPSGVKFEDLEPEKMVVINLGGDVIEGKLSVSTDTASHLYIYQPKSFSDIVTLLRY